MTATYFSDVHKCPMAAFLDCLIDENYRALIITGECADEELYILQDAFLSMQEKYSEMLGDVDSMMWLKLIREINYARADLNVARTLINIGPTAWIERWEKYLNKIFKVSYKADATNRLEFLSALKSWESRISGLEMAVDLKQIRADQIKVRLDKRVGGKPKREDFSVIFNLMEEHYKVVVNEHIISVARYCDRYKRMSQLSKKQKQYSNGRK